MIETHKYLAPELIEGNFVFCTTKKLILSPSEFKGAFHEKEGITYILLKDVADFHGLPYASTWSCISLKYESDLEMVGLTASFSHELANENIPCNVVAGYFHDHLFVPPTRAKDAMRILAKITI